MTDDPAANFFSKAVAQIVNEALEARTKAQYEDAALRLLGVRRAIESTSPGVEEDWKPVWNGVCATVFSMIAEKNLLTVTPFKEACQKVNSAVVTARESIEAADL